MSRKPYPFSEFEPKWQRTWVQTGAFRATNPGDPNFDPLRPKYYILDMFPYPSGEGLHVGHVEGYTATDIIARYKRMRGFNVLHPMGWDAFGLPAEQYAIRTGQHPRVTTEKNVTNFRSQLQGIGFSYDWDREISTTDPAYFRWTQWIFLRLYNSWFDPSTQRVRPIAELPEEHRANVDNHRLAYVADMPVNWCPELGTVLANEEVVDGLSEVGGFPVERRALRQWVLRITAIADRLISELDGLDWPESIKQLQRNWIGRSEGARVFFPIEGCDTKVEVYTTRPDTLFGATYIVLSPEHALVSAITTEGQRSEVEKYQADVASKSDLERTELAKEKTGTFTGAFAINPVNGARIPVWIADYVLASYGTGAIMAVPAHDVRDFEFAEKFALPVIRVIEPPEPTEGCFAGEGIAIASQPINGLPTAEAKAKMLDWLETEGIGRRAVQVRLRDWLFSRQRYWGEPFPIVWENGCHRPLSDEELPVVPPDLDDFKPTKTAEPPLAKATEWIRYSETARREVNTMPQWAGSCWYYLRFCDPRNAGRFVGKEAESYWMGRSGAGESTRPGGVDLYVGGTEHAVLHLLYARFWHKVLFDLGEVSTPEPFQRLVNQGLILGPDGQKMSKSRGNVVNPDTVVGQHGADALRLYEMFMGPLEQMKPWSATGVEGVSRFLARVWRLAFEEDQEGNWVVSPQLNEMPFTSAQDRVVHASIKKVTEDVEALSFNTAIAQMMIYVNEFTGANPRPAECMRVLLKLLSPFAPHLCEEAGERLAGTFPGFEKPVSAQEWPTFDEARLIESEVEWVLQINGKLRDKMLLAKGSDRADAERVAMESAKIQEAISGKEIVKVIVVPEKLVNIVVR